MKEALAWAGAHWREAIDFVIIGLGIYGVWRLVRATRGAKVLFAVVLALSLIHI